MSNDPSNHLLIKVGGAVFATVVAPLIVALGLKWFDSPPQQLPASAPALPVAPSPPVGQHAPTSSASPLTSGADAAAQSTTGVGQVATAGPASTSPLPAQQPTEPVKQIDLFNGRDLSGFHVRSPHKSGQRDPAAGGKSDAAHPVFSVREGMIHATGQHSAGLVSDEEFSNYRLTLEFKWGEQTWPPREKNARVSGVLLHAKSVGGGGRLAGIRCVLGEGETGDMAVVGMNDDHPLSFRSTAEPRERSEDKPRLDRFQFRPDAVPVEISHGYVSRLGHAPRWKDTKGFRGRRDVENAQGEWNTVECLCRAGRIEVRVNGKLVNVATHCSVRKGRIVLQSIFAEVFFRKVQLEELAADMPGV
jgi:hypothetical protein